MSASPITAVHTVAVAKTSPRPGPQAARASLSPVQDALVLTRAFGRSVDKKADRLLTRLPELAKITLDCVVPSTGGAGGMAAVAMGVQALMGGSLLYGAGLTAVGGLALYATYWTLKKISTDNIPYNQ